MKSLVERYSNYLPHELDYTSLLLDTNIFGRGRFLVPDKESLSTIATMISEAEAHLDMSSAIRLLTEGSLCSPDEMKTSCELEYWAFFKPNHFSRVLYIGSGAVPMIALYVLTQDSDIAFDGIDISPQATVLCSQIVAKLGYQNRLRPSTINALELNPETIQQYDGFFISSAVRPKNIIIDRLFQYKKPSAKIYAREDASHPDFYELVEISHPDLLTARKARLLWEKEMGSPYPLPRGCEIDPTD